MSRRLFCRSTLSLALLPKFAFAGDLAARSDLGSRCVDDIRSHLSALPPGPVLLNSYLVEEGAHKSDFDLTQATASYVYDNALAGLLLCAAGFTSEAKRIGNALDIAQNHDRFYRDGRLRNAYQAGVMTDPAKLPGWWNKQEQRWNEDPYQVGSQAGPIAWAILLWAALGMEKPARAAAKWISESLKAERGYYGGFDGFEPSPLKLPWQSTEQNVDLFVAFSKLGMHDEADHARHFVAQMLNGKVYRAGLTPEKEPNNMLAADAGIWPYLAKLGSQETALNAIKRLTRGHGIGFSEASHGIWLEGTAFAVLASKDLSPTEAFLLTIDRNLSPDGYVYATVDPMLSTGLAVGPPSTVGQPAPPFNYYRRPSLSATAWAGLASMNINPFSLLAK